MTFIVTNDQARAIARGEQTQLRRIVKPGEVAQDDRGYVVVLRDGKLNNERTIDRLLTASGRLKWQVDRDYALRTAGNRPGVWIDTGGKVLPSPQSVYARQHPECTVVTREMMEAIGWRPLRIVITALRLERLQDISEADARAEGVEATPVTGVVHGPGPTTIWSYQVTYADLWDTINTRKGTRWQDNPLVWCLTFRVKE